MNISNAMLLQLLWNHHDDHMLCHAQGLTAAPPDLVTKIVDATPSPTPDPTSVIVSKISSITTDVSGALQKLTGFAPPPGGLSQVCAHTANFSSSSSFIKCNTQAAAGRAAFDSILGKGRRPRNVLSRLKAYSLVTCPFVMSAL